MSNIIQRNKAMILEDKVSSLENTINLIEYR